jgi:hypothetical protein
MYRAYPHGVDDHAVGGPRPAKDPAVDGRIALFVPLNLLISDRPSNK